MPLETVVVSDPLLSFVKPVYVIREPSSLKSFSSFDVTTYSNSQVNTTLNLNSTDFVLDPNIIYNQPVRVTINGTTGGQNVLVDGCFGLRNQACSAIMSSLSIKYGSQSYDYQIGDVISAMAHYNLNTAEKYSSGFDLAMLDKTQNYEDLLGAQNNPLGYYANAVDQVTPRGAYPVNIVSNTPTQAVFTTTLRQLLVSPPLRDQMERGGIAGAGLSHLSNIGINITFQSNAGNRLLSLAKNRFGDVLNVTNIVVDILMPTFEFVQLKSRNEQIPRCLAYAMESQERYPYQITLPFGVPTQINVSSFSLSRVPDCAILYARPSNNAYLNNANGVHIPDCFAQISQLTIQYDGQSLISPSASPAQLYKMAYENGVATTFQQWSAQPTLKTVGAGVSPAQYMNGVGSVLKLRFGKDISLYPDIVSGSYNNTSISLTATLTNLCPSTNDFTFYILLLYSDVLELFDNSLATINLIPLSDADVKNRHGSEKVHYDIIRHSPDLSGGARHSSGSLLKSGKVASLIKTMKGVLSNPAVRSGIKSTLRSVGMSKQADMLESVGFGRKPRRKSRGRGRMHGGGDIEGGAYASKEQLKHSLLKTESETEYTD